MLRKIAVFVVVVLSLAGNANALYDVSDKGEWPKTWSKELEPLRAQAKTFVGPTVQARHYAIPFTKRDAMEAAWPELLKAKSPGAPIVLRRGQSFFLGKASAGVVVHSPPEGQHKNPKTPEAPIEGLQGVQRFMNMTYIELLVDGDIVDLNRLKLPPETLILDERFEDK